MKFEAYTAVEMNLLAPSSCNQAVGSSETLKLELNYMVSHFRRHDFTVLCTGMILLFFPQSSVRVSNDVQNTQSLFP
jgi:hypothetical protein